MRMITMALALLLIFCSISWADQSDLIWSTFLGGSSEDGGLAIDVDVLGNVYVAGYTYSTDFPTTSTAFDTSHNGNYDAYVAKLNSTGGNLVYATFIGGSNQDEAKDITLDGMGNAYIVGLTWSPNFPTTAGALDTTRDGADDAFVAKLDWMGSGLEYCTLLGGSNQDWAYGVAVDYSNMAYVTGWTSSTDFPTTAGAFDTTHNGGGEAFVAKLNETGSALEYGTYLGGSGYDRSNAIVVEDPEVYVVGLTDSENFPTTSRAFDDSLTGLGDAFIVKFDMWDDTLAYSTYLGGNSYEVANDIALDEFGNVYLTGVTSSEDFATMGAYDTTYNGGDYDAFVAKLNETGNLLEYATYLGGDTTDMAYGIAVDYSGAAYLAGYTLSSDFPTTSEAFDITHNGPIDAFVAKLNTTGDTLKYASFLGGSLWEYGFDLAMDQFYYIYVTGSTRSSDFPTTPGAFDTTHGGSFCDAFVAKLDISGIISPPMPVSDLAISKAGEDHIRLSWSAVTLDLRGKSIQTDVYNIYRDTVLHVEQCTIFYDGTAELFYLDEAIGDPENQYYYSVTALSSGWESQFSNVVGEFDKQLSSGMK
jgi:hypothetical protein